MQRAIRILICRAGAVRLDRLSTWGAVWELVGLVSVGKRSALCAVFAMMMF